MTPEATRLFLRSMFDAAVAAAMPEQCVPQNLPPKPKGRTIVVGAGKASAAMAQVFEKAWDDRLEGLIVTRYGHAVPCEHIEIVEAAHPVPDDAGTKGARRMLSMVRGLSPDDLVVALISGGGSALLSLPAEGISVGRETRREPGTAQEWCADFGNELRAQASLGHQGRKACGGCLSGAGCEPGDF